MLPNLQTSILVLLALTSLWLMILRLRMRGGIRIPLGLSLVALTGMSYLMLDQFAPILNKLPNLEFATAKQLVALVFWLCVAYTVNVCIKRFVYGRRLTAEGDYKVPLIIQYLVTVLVYMVAVMIIVRMVFDQPIFALAATSGALAIVLGYSARSVLDEIFAGIALNFSSPFEKGDLIQLNDEWALVKDIGWRSITYLDMDSNDVVVPNSVVAASKIRNLDKPGGLTRRIYYFRVPYNVPPKVVLDLAYDAYAECPHILDHEWNDTAVYALDETGIKYRAAFHIAHYNDWWLASNEYFNALWYSFSRAGIKFAQQRHLNFQPGESLDQGPPLSALDDNNWRSLIEQFNNSPMFEGMTPEDMQELAKSATLHVVGPPERIIRAGSKRSSMYLLASGQADVYEVAADGTETWMAEVGEGETVGLMALLVGTPQRTTVRARTEAAVWEISSESLHALFERKPEVMGNIAEAVARWQAEEDEALAEIKLSRDKSAALVQKRSSSLRGMISKFFDRGREDDDVTDSYTGY